MVIIHATFYIDLAKEDKFLIEIQPLIEGSQAESDNVYYRLQKDTEKENVYMMVEVWKDQEAVAIHNASDHFTSFVAKVNEFLTAPLDIQAFEGQPIKL